MCVSNKGKEAGKVRSVNELDCFQEEFMLSSLRFGQFAICLVQVCIGFFLQLLERPGLLKSFLFQFTTNGRPVEAANATFFTIPNSLPAKQGI